MPDLFGWYSPPAANMYGLDPSQATLNSSLTYLNKGNREFSPYAAGEDGRGNVVNWGQFSNLGYDTSSFYGTGQDAEGSPTNGIYDMEAADKWLADNGLRVAQQPLDGSRFANYIVDRQGNIVGEPFIGDNKDTNFQLAAIAAAGIATAGIAGWASAGAGAAEAGVGTLGTIPAGTGAVAPLPTMGTVGATTLPEVVGIGAGAAGTASLPAGSVAGTGLQTINVTAPAYGSGIGTLPAGVGESLGTVASLPTNAQAGISAMSTGGSSFSWDSILKGLSNGGARSIFDIASGLYGMNLASDASKASDPFAQYRAGYGEQLQQLQQNPSSITQTPGWRAGLEGVDKQMAARGYYGSGNMDAARSRYAGDFYQQESARLAGLAGAGQTPGAGQYNSAALAGQSLASIGYGLAPWIGGRQP